MSTSYADPAVLQRIRQCTSKRAFGTEERGWQVAKKIFRRYFDLQGPYRCRHCGLWHTGHPRSAVLQAELRQRSLSW